MRWIGNFIFILMFLIAAGAGCAQGGEEAAQGLKMAAYRYYYGKAVPIDYAKALQLYLQAAELGDAEAQFIVGGMLYKGLGSAPDKINGFKWLLKAAEQGKISPESLNIIGGMYLRGANVPQNYLEAKNWLAKAAEKGNVPAQNDLAYLLFNGLGGERDYKKALDLYEKAAFKGDVMAQANAGLMHALGIGTSIDKARGYAWYSLAACQGNTHAIINRNNLMLEMTWEELNRAQALSVELYNRIEKITEPGSRPAAAHE